MTPSNRSSNLGLLIALSLTAANPALADRPGSGGGELIAPRNDSCADAVVATSPEFSDSTVTDVATTDASDPTPNCGNSNRGRSVWYRFEPSTDGSLSVDTHDTDYDTILSTYTGSCETPVPVLEACNDDDPLNGAQSRIDFPVAGGETYLFMITAYRNEGGLLLFNLRFTGASASCQGDCDGSGAVTVDELVMGLNIALGSETVDRCLAVDRDTSGSVTVDEVLQALQGALNGC